MSKVTIDKECFAKLKELGLPMTVVVNDKQGKKLTEAEIRDDGSIKDLQTSKVYSAPSLLRDELIGSNESTYKYLVLTRNLSDLGVKRNRDK
ncbi:hypothetical protein KW516_07375 [Vibrio fluvialis]|uniref:hypothetical protein n=1 Tax=Vibrio fluvialis TaxID=676 RepID=UPI000C224FB8|nr:hypothetical protein [Vibrio fluvialis]EKO3393175.1 hypothetical protein [Vibrio fluvialis]EKO3908334.1 hypothetical protein [Vibrio fluvialis]MBY7826901.1 hypothetical protein [Vibrio fluvialis]MBY7885186.1 hypothetical protein [Vibrio fluvialis]MBY7928105.1 hypothetical protein [Vibrio fluvialis]